jgi:hypothetical protein
MYPSVPASRLVRSLISVSNAWPKGVSGGSILSRRCRGPIFALYEVVG